jgi:biopolymer transport protein ExbD
VAASLRLSSDAPDEEPAMLMTSMIDVIFILLAFFVCVTELKKGHLLVDVPRVADPQVNGPPRPGDREPIVVEVSAKDEVYIGGKRAETEADLARLIGEAAARSGKDATVHVSGDRQSRNGTMMRIVAQLSRAGLSKIQFAVEAGGGG